MSVSCQFLPLQSTQHIMISNLTKALKEKHWKQNIHTITLSKIYPSQVVTVQSIIVWYPLIHVLYFTWCKWDQTNHIYLSGLSTWAVRFDCTCHTLSSCDTVVSSAVLSTVTVSSELPDSTPCKHLTVSAVSSTAQTKLNTMPSDCRACAAYSDISFTCTASV